MGLNSRAVPYLIMAVWLCGCNTTGPQPVSFEITSLVFSGDSIGEDLLSQVSFPLEGRPKDGSRPFCEFTLEWNAPSSTLEHEYTVYRSLSPGISAHPENAVELGSTGSQMIWVDSKDLEWGAVYYYAVRASTIERDHLWSTEAHVEGPESPYPPGAELSVSEFGLGYCRLEWTPAEHDGFQSYILVRSFSPDLEQNLPYNNDTVFVSREMGLTSYSDSSSAFQPRYYAVVTEYSGRPDPYSNEVEFTSNPGIPWRVSASLNIGYVFDHQIAFLSRDDSYLLVIADEHYSGFPPWDFQGIQKRSTSSGSLNSSWGCNCLCACELQTGEIALCRVTGGGQYVGLSILSDQLQHLRSMELVLEALCMVDTPEGLLVSTEDCTLIIDPLQLEITGTLEDLSFTAEALSPDRNHLCVSDGVSDITVLDTRTFTVIGSLPRADAFCFDSAGNIHCTDGELSCTYDGSTLEIMDSFVFPQTVPELQGLSYLQPSARYLYGWCLDPGSGITVYVLDTQEKELTGHFDASTGVLYGPELLLSASDGSFLWGLAFYEMAYPRYLKLGI